MHGQPSSMSGSAWGSDQEGGNQMDEIHSWINMYDQTQVTPPPQPRNPRRNNSLTRTVPLFVNRRVVADGGSDTFVYHYIYYYLAM